MTSIYSDPKTGQNIGTDLKEENVSAHSRVRTGGCARAQTLTRANLALCPSQQLSLSTGSTLILFTHVSIGHVLEAQA